MNNEQLLEKTREITTRFSPHTKPWNDALTQIALEYLHDNGNTVDASVQVQQTVSMVVEEHLYAQKYMEGRVKL